MSKPLKLKRWVIKFRDHYADLSLATVYAPTEKQALDVIRERLKELITITQDRIETYE